MQLTEDNFLIYCAHYYDNPQCQSNDEFLEDLRRIKYIKKLITRYVEKGDLKERLILNHLIVLNNLFRPQILNKIIFFKMKDQLPYIKPFLILLNILPQNDDTDNIPMDQGIIDRLRKI